MRNELGTLLRDLRGRRSLRNIAEITGLSHGYIRQLELGEHQSRQTPVRPSIESLQKIADAYSVPLMLLLERTNTYLESIGDLAKEDEEIITREEREMIRMYRNISTADQEKVKSLLNELYHLNPNVH